MDHGYFAGICARINSDKGRERGIGNFMVHFFDKCDIILMISRFS